jgi:hypothetical protein
MGVPDRSIIGHSLEWQQAYMTSAPEDGAQRNLVAQLALPMNAGQTREQAQRVQALQAQITLMEPATARRMYARLTSRADSLGNLFYLTLHPATIRSLLTQLNAKQHESDRGTAPVQRATDNHGTDNRGTTPVPPHQRPPKRDTRPGPSQPPRPPGDDNPPPWKPPRVVSPFPVPPPWEQDENLATDLTPSKSQNWVQKTLLSAATFLGTTVSVGLRAVSSVTMEKAIEAAWLVFQVTEAEPAALIGMAGEAAAEAFLADILGVDPATVRNLNDIEPNFPVLDLISPRFVASVKTRGVLSTLPASALTEQLSSQYVSDLLSIIDGEKKLDKAAEALLRSRKALGRAWPTDLRATTVDGIANYIREKAILSVPSDHVQPLRRSLGQNLARRLQNNKKLLDQLGIKNSRQLSAYVNKQIDRIHSMGPSSGDLRVMAETVNHLPPDVNESFRKKYAKILARRAKRAGQ